MIDYLARLAITSAHSMLRPKVSAMDEVRTPLRVWLTDIDINGHINNGRYLTLMDFARLDHSIRTGMFDAIRKNRWWPLMGGATIQFRKELRTGVKFELTTRVAAWDPKWFYAEQRFERGGEVHATAFVKVVVKKKRQTIPPAELMAALGHTGPSPEPSEALSRFILTPHR